MRRFRCLRGLPRALAGPLLAAAALWACALGAVAQTYTSASTAYSFIDSSAHTKVGHNTAPYKFNASTGCATTPPVLDDTLSDAIPIGFSFRFGTTNYASLYIMSNGRLQFGNTTCGAGTTSIGPPQTYPYGYPNASMNATMKVFGVDLDATNLVDRPNYPSAANKTPCTSTATCYVSVATIGSAPSRQFVVTWKGVPEWVSATNTSGSFDIQAILNEDGSFVYQYGTISHGGTGTAQIGWQLSTTDYQVLAFGAALEPPPNTAIIFYIPSPIASYRFDEGAWAPGLAAQVIDSSGNARHGTTIGAAQTTAAGKLCRGADIPLNTSDTQVDAVRLVDISNAALNLLGSGTVAFWYRAGAAWNSGQPAQLLDATAVAGEWFYLARTSTGSLVFAVKDSTGVLRSVETPAQAFAAGTWVHVAVAWSFNGLAGANQDSLRIFINGGAPTVASFTSSGTVTSQARVIHVGDNPLGLADTRGSVNSAFGVIDEVQIYNYVLSTAQMGVLIAATRSCAPFLFDHFELQHASGSGVTCAPSTVTIRACLNPACTSLYTGGVAAALTATGGPPTNFDGSTGYGSGAAFVIPAGSSSTTKTFQVASPGLTRLGTGGTTVTSTGATTCNFGSPACTFTASDSGFVFDVPNHVAEVPQTVAITAVRKSDNSPVCVPAFASVTRSLRFTCSYSDPAAGTLPVRIAGGALNAGNNPSAACDAGGRSIPLAFDAGGAASLSVQYADVGRVGLSASYSGSSGNEAGLLMTGSDSFVAAPARFDFSGLTPGPIKAGLAFSVAVTARNSAGAATPGFGREAAPESAALGFTRRSPTGAGASNGIFSGSLGAFAGGVAGSANLVWSEVGTGDLSATLQSGNYLGSGLTASGSTGAAGAVGRFIPHHFDVAVTPACSGTFSYAGQPFAVRVTARNGLAVPGTTVNYDGSPATAPGFARLVSLSEAVALGVGSLANASIAAAAFTAGVALASPSYAFTAKQTAPQTLALRATDTDAVTSNGHLEGSTPLRSGRLRLVNSFGSAAAPLAVPVRAEYWSGNAWLLNSADSCTTLPASAVAISNPRNHQGVGVAVTTSASAITLAGGNGSLGLAAPTPAASGVSFDLALNLGNAAADQSCNPAHPAAPGAALAWLRSLNGACAATFDRDPAARASFGIYSPESRRTVHVRELY